MLARLLVVPAALATLALTPGCDRSNGGRHAQAPPTAGSEQTAAALPTPTQPASLIDQTVHAVTSRDVEGLVSRFALSEVACSSDMWPLPPCAAGEAEGTLTPRFPFVGCEPAFLTEGELRFVLERIILDRSPELLVVVDTGIAPKPTLFPVGPTAVIFSTSPPDGSVRPTGVLLVLDESGRVISLRTGCRATPQELVSSVAAERDGHPSPWAR